MLLGSIVEHFKSEISSDFHLEGRLLMIFRETKDFFIMTTQHDHAKLSGTIAQFFKPQFFVDDTFIEKTVLAISEHDRSWIGLDEIPIWNDNENAPFSFM